MTVDTLTKPARCKGGPDREGLLHIAQGDAEYKSGGLRDLLGDLGEGRRLGLPPPGTGTTCSMARRLGPPIANTPGTLSVTRFTSCSHFVLFQICSGHDGRRRR